MENDTDIFCKPHYALECTIKTLDKSCLLLFCNIIRKTQIWNSVVTRLCDSVMVLSDLLTIYVALLYKVSANGTT